MLYICRGRERKEMTTTTTIRISLDAKKQLERIATLENLTLKKTVERSIGFYEIAILRRFLGRKKKFTPELVEAFHEAKEWLARTQRQKAGKIFDFYGEKIDALYEIIQNPKTSEAHKRNANTEIQKVFKELGFSSKGNLRFVKDGKEIPIKVKENE